MSGEDASAGRRGRRRAASDDADDATVVVPSVDRTVVVPHTDRAVHTGSHGSPAATGTGGVPGATGSGGDAVPEPEHELSPEMREQMFKKPLDPKRRAPKSPFPLTDSERSRGGVRPSIPVLHGPRIGTTLPVRGGVVGPQIGPPPADSFVGEAVRDALPSVERANRRYGWVAFGGGAAVLGIVVAGTWVILALLLG